MRLPKICGGFLNLTQKCNLNCRYCFVHQQPLEMDFQTAKDAAIFYANNALNELVTPQVTFFGGEPMLKYKSIIKPLVEFIRETYGDFELSITTNGTLNNEEVYGFFKENDVGMLLSLDGMKEIQDFNRPFHNGKGSYDKIDIDLYLKYYPEGTFRATVDPDTVHLLFENYKWGEEKGFKHCSFIVNSFGDWTDEKMNIFKSELDKVANHVIEARKNNRSYMIYNEIEKMKDDYNFMQNIDNEYFRDKGQHLPACGTCGLGAGRFGSIGSSGNIYSCQEMSENPDHDEFIIGNIYTGVDDKKRMELACSFNFKNVKSTKEGRCETCKLNPICNGRCVLKNFWDNGTLDVMPESLCNAYEYYFEKYEEIIREVK